MSLSVEKTVTYFGNHHLDFCFLLHVLTLFCGICLHCSLIAIKCATSVIINPLAYNSGHIAKEEAFTFVRAHNECWRPLRGEDSTDGCPISWTKLDRTGPRQTEDPPPLLLECTFLPSFPKLERFRNAILRE